MSEEAHQLQYECLEPDCGWTAASPSEDELVETVTAHMADEHETFELEDVILAGCVSVGGAEAK